MKPGGLGIFTVPVSGEAETWEPPDNMPTEEIEAICGWDHKRLYGLDFADRLRRVGFDVSLHTPSPEDKEKYCLLSDIIFLAHKSI
jgi:hypothetical protein